MPQSIPQPLTFEPLFKERVWGGRSLEQLFGKRLPPGVKIGESWELVDRPDAQSVVRNGQFRGQTLHDLWTRHRETVFGAAPDAERFPLLIKLLDAQEKLSVQVHPPPHVAAELGGEPKTELWYIADAVPEAELYVGLTRTSSKPKFIEATKTRTAAEQLHRIGVKRGDVMFLPSGRVHAVGGGNVIVEVQQNSDTTYRVHDWDRTDRDLHIEKALHSIDFNDVEPGLTQPEGESLVSNELFSVEKWQLDRPRPAADEGGFSIICCLTGAVRCGDVTLQPGELFLVPATLRDRSLAAKSRATSLLRITI